MTDFFAEHSQFFETSPVGSWPWRLKLRYEAIIAANQSLFHNAHVIDLASHDGRWSLAALKAGAAHVTGVEIRQELIDNAYANMRHYGIVENRFDFIIDDLNHKRTAPAKCDLVMCLGYFYHTLNHHTLFEYMASTDAQHLILDGMVDPSDAPVIRLYTENVDHPANGLTESGVVDGDILVGHLSVASLTMMARQFGYVCDVYDWNALIARHHAPNDPSCPHGPDNPVGDYAGGRRATLLARKTRATH